MECKRTGEFAHSESTHYESGEAFNGEVSEICGVVCYATKKLTIHATCWLQALRGGLQRITTRCALRRRRLHRYQPHHVEWTSRVDEPNALVECILPIFTISQQQHFFGPNGHFS